MKITRAETDLKAVRSVAHLLLNMDIQPTKFSPAIVSHPFTSSGFPGIAGKDGEIRIVSLTNNPEDLKAWRRQVATQIDKANSAFEVFSLVNKPYALAFAKYAAPHLSEKDFGQILSIAWTISEAPNKDANMTRRELLTAFCSVAPEYLMDEAELAQYCDLENLVTVYRGVTLHNAKNTKALSWTLDLETAEWFDHRFNQEGLVYEAQIEKQHIFALFTRRGESEVIVNPHYLQNIHEIEMTPQAQTLTM